MENENIRNLIYQLERKQVEMDSEDIPEEFTEREWDSFCKGWEAAMDMAIQIVKENPYMFRTRDGLDITENNSLNEVNDLIGKCLKNAPSEEFCNEKQNEIYSNMKNLQESIEFYTNQENVESDEIER